MIPKIQKNRTKLKGNLHAFPDSVYLLYVTSDNYPDIFNFHYPDIRRKTNKNWNQKDVSDNQKYLWFPSNTLDQSDIDTINSWIDRFSRYVLLGMNRNLENKLNYCLNFCMALDFNMPEPDGNRTEIGEELYQYKYQNSAEHGTFLVCRLADALEDLPIPAIDKDKVFITAIPSEQTKGYKAHYLAMTVSKKREIQYIQADLFCKKSEMKNISLEQKIQEWHEIYTRPDCIELQENISDRTAIIIDDLYQSGATMCRYAEYLKQQGAKYVLGLACVKTLRDTDNR